jgi:hypothetical protein
MLAKFKIVEMGGRSRFPNEHQLVLGAIECAHAAVGLVPDANVFQFRIHLISRPKHFLHVAPVHAGVVNRPVVAMGRKLLKSLRQKTGESWRGHFTATHRKGAVVNLTLAADITVDSHVVRWVGKNQTGFAAVEQIVVGCAVKRITTKYSVKP